MNKTVEIKYEEGEGPEQIEFSGLVILKRLNFSEKNALEEESTEIKFFGNMPQVKVSTSKMKELALFKSITSSNLFKTVYYEDKVTKANIPSKNPYDLGIEGIRNLPQDIGEELFLTFNELNNISDKKKEQ